MVFVFPSNGCISSAGGGPRPVLVGSSLTRGGSRSRSLELRIHQSAPTLIAQLELVHGQWAPVNGASQVEASLLPVKIHPSPPPLPVCNTE
ncbi:hypothetical protein CRG98_028143 [Punica granatum]|uniref:Uncharacterized protein n=1 Tax=Punica granatum TaxID=22663 RepID=A0A2I0J5C7_PUNGR|nr:hypothetical protein CRG98_028143 [Punica granatum]